jgi:hypothetical protein
MWYHVVWLIGTIVHDECGRGQLKCDGTCAETRFRLSVKQTSPHKSAGASVQSTTGSRGLRISGSNAGYTMFQGSVKGTGYPLHSPVSPSLPLVCHRVPSRFNWSLPPSSEQKNGVPWRVRQEVALICWYLTASAWHHTLLVPSFLLYIHIVLLHLFYFHLYTAEVINFTEDTFRIMGPGVA